LKTDTATADVK